MIFAVWHWNIFTKIILPSCTCWKVMNGPIFYSNSLSHDCFGHSKAKNEEPCSFFIDQSLFPATKRCLHIGRGYLDLAPQVILLCPSWWWGSSLIVQHIDVWDKGDSIREGVNGKKTFSFGHCPNTHAGIFWPSLNKCIFGQEKESISSKMPMYWTFNCFLGCIYTVYCIVYIVVLVLNWLSNLEFRLPKKEDQVARIGVMGGV